MPNWTPVVPAAQPADPYLEWATETKYADLFAGLPEIPDEDKWFPILIELADGVTLQQFVADMHALAKSDPIIDVPSIYADPPTGLADVSFLTATVKKAFLDLLTQSKTPGVKRFELGLPLKSPPKPTAWKKTEPRRTAAKVVTAVIDDGIAFANARFRLENDKTRIEYIWNQDGLPLAPPDGFSSGWELSKAGGGGVDGIDKLLDDCKYAGIVDEDQVYAYEQRRHIDFRQSGTKPVARRVSHGTHVMDLAAGYAQVENKSKRPIIAVQLPVASTMDTSGASLAAYVIPALWYIVSRADMLSAKPLPIVVNLSYGYFAGPHDASSVLEKAIDDLILARTSATKRPLRVVIPAGNSRLARCHAELAPALQEKNPKPLAWRISPEDLTPSFVEIWLPKPPTGPSAVVTVTVETPTGDVTPQPIKEGEEWVWQDATTGDILCKVLYLNTTAPGRTRNMIFIAVAPTATLSASRKLAPSGVWKITIENVGNVIDVEDPIHAWIQRDDTPYGYPRRGRQSYFDDKDYERFDFRTRELEVDNGAYVKRDATMNAIATGEETFVVGGFRRSDWKTAKYSAGGPVVKAARMAPWPDGPDAMAVTDDSVAHRGMLATGTRSGSTVALSGTSVAAPQFTRAIAGEMAKPGMATRQDMSDSVNVMPTPPGSESWNEANRPAAAPGLAPTPERHGAGRMEFRRRVDVHRYRYEK
jgi:hypothetical protein